MRPSIEFAFLDADAVWCLNESSLSIHTPKSFSHVVSSSFTVCAVWLVIVYVYLGEFFPTLRTVHFFSLKFSCQVSAHSWS